MKPFVFVITSVFILTFGYTQELSGVIKYRYMYSKDPIQIPQGGRVVGDKVVSDFNLPAYLYFNAQKSLFDYDKEDYNKETNYKRKQDKYGQMYFMDKNKGELYVREFIYRNTYITHEKIPVISWQLKNEVKTIAGYVCKKATAEFRGRKYTAWYTPSIPASVGPWKLQGLPGTILEAESEDGQVRFIVESIRIPADVQKELSIEQLPDGKVVSFEEYLQSFEKERKDAITDFQNLFFTALEEKYKSGEIKINPKDITMTEGRKMFTIEKYE